MSPNEGKVFNLKPQLTLAMKLAATFAITYYGLLLIYEVFTLVFSRYFIDSYYLGADNVVEGSSDYLILIIQLVLSVTLVFSLIQIFRKKNHGKAIFVGASLLLIVFQLITTGFVPWLKYALEVLLVLIIAPLRVKKKIKIKEGKVTLEEVKEEAEDAVSNEEETSETENPSES